ncbi:MAG: hypothetical protein AAGJ86_10090 [Pseudomonadota bacterium]
MYETTPQNTVTVSGDELAIQRRIRLPYSGLKRDFFRSTLLLALAWITGCSITGNQVDSDVLPIPVAANTMESPLLTVLSTRTLKADGASSGKSAYDLIRDFGGPRSIESPDLYSVNHPDVPHIFEDSDDEVGDHFVFVVHRDKDRDRDRQNNTDRQRNEIKTYKSSERAVKGFENETLVFRWLFRINEDMTVSRRFTHFFQLKAVGGDDRQPIVTITGVKRSGEGGIEVRHSPSRGGTVLQRIDWSEVTGEWLQAYCRATFSEDGALRLIVTRLSDNAVVFDIEVTGLDLWRGKSREHFVRPKWGIYRSILLPDELRPDEEEVRFADFSISKVVIN